MKNAQMLCIPIFRSSASAVRNQWRSAMGAMVRVCDFGRHGLLPKSLGECDGSPSRHFEFGQFSFAHFFLKKKWALELQEAVVLICLASGQVTSCSLPTQPDLLVSSLRCSPSAFDSFRANTEIRYTLAKPATVTITIAQRNSSGQLILVNTLAENINETKGSHGHTWLGDTAAGLFAESGNYIAVLQIENNQYEAGIRVFHF